MCSKTNEILIESKILKVLQPSGLLKEIRMYFISIQKLMVRRGTRTPSLWIAGPLL